MAIKLKNCLFAGALLYAAVFALYGNASVSDDPRWTAGTVGAYSGTQFSGQVPYSAIGKFSDVSSGFPLEPLESTPGRSGRMGGEAAGSAAL